MSTTAEPTEADKIDELIDAAAPPVKRREQTIVAGETSKFPGFERTYVQMKLSFFGKLEFVRIVGKAVDNLVNGSGEDDRGLKLAELFGVGSVDEIKDAAKGAMADGGVSENTQSFIDMFVRAILRLSEFTPDLLKDIYMIALGVPSHEREIVSEILDEPYNEDDGTGGISDEDGIEIMETFIAQNVRVMRDLYRERLPKIVAQVREAVASDQTPARSKPSKRSARSTR